MKSIGTTKKNIERDSGGARIVEGWEQVVKATARNVTGNGLILSNIAAKWWDEEVNESNRVRR